MGRFNGAAPACRGGNPPQSARFNGAAATSPRKPASVKRPPGGVKRLQWGRGYVAAQTMVKAVEGPDAILLQSGRGDKKGETWQHCTNMGFNGAAPACRGGNLRGYLRARQQARPLQRGRGRVAPETGVIHCNEVKSTLASMGPRPRGRGNTLKNASSNMSPSLQWGRGHVAAEI